MVSVKAGALSGCSSWAPAFFLSISTYSGSSEMLTCISTASARAKSECPHFRLIIVRGILPLQFRTRWRL